MLVLGLRFLLRPAIPGWCLGLCALVCALRLYPAYPGLGCAVWVCVLEPGLPLRPATPGWGFGACVFVRTFRLYPAIPGSGVRCGCVCLRLGFGCAPPVLAGVVGCVFGCLRSVCTPPILAGVCGVGVGAWAQVAAAPRHSWLGFWSVCVFVCPPPVLCHCWLECAVWVCVLRFRF